MKGSLRIRHFGFLISVIVIFTTAAFLTVVPSVPTSGQKTVVKCPCDYELVPKDEECWIDLFDQNPTYSDGQSPLLPCEIRNFSPTSGSRLIRLEVTGTQSGAAAECEITPEDRRPPTCGPFGDKNEFLTPEELTACRCELIEYATELNALGILPDQAPFPPYTCEGVTEDDCRQLVPTPIPTLNEYAMIITAGVLGLLTVIGLFVMRARRTVAGGRGPDGANQ